MDVGTLPRRVRRENPDITSSPLTRGTRAHPARRCDRKPASRLRRARRAHHAAATRAPSTPRAPATVTAAAHTPPQQHPQPQNSTAHEHATLHAAHAARTRIAPPSEAAPPNSEASGNTHERRHATTKRCCVPTRAQSRRRRSMGHVKTWCTPRQRGPVARAGVLLLPPMRAWLEQPHGRRHKAPPQPCALTTNKRARQILSHFHRYLELRVSRRPRSFAKRVRKWAISKVGHHMSLCGYACSFKNLPRSHPTGAVRRDTTANPLELPSSPLMMETIARQSSHRF